MICVKYNKNSELIVDEIPIPKLGPNDALIKINACGVCGSDLVKIKNDLVPKGTVLGHEVVGTIADTGHLVKRWAKGQKVVVAHHVPCLNCHFCKSDNYSMCKQFKETNISPGGFSEYIKISKIHLEQTTFLIPGGTVTDQEIAFTEPLACCIRAVERSGITTSCTALISGLGSIGQLMGMLCSKKGSYVVGTDLLDKRIALSNTLKTCDAAYKANSNALTDAINTKTNSRGVDIVFLCSGSEKGLYDALKYVRPGGKIIVLSSISSNAGFSNSDIYYKELSIIGSYSPSPTSLKDAYQMIITGKIKLKKLITDVVTLEHLPKEIKKCFTSESLKMMVKPN